MIVMHNREILAVIYCRVSDSHQAGEDKVSLHEQEREGRDYRRRMACRVLRVYVDIGRNGDVLERPELLRLLKDMRRGEFDVIVAHKIDCFSRDPEIQAFVKVQGRLHDVRLEFVQMGPQCDADLPRLIRVRWAAVWGSVDQSPSVWRGRRARRARTRRAPAR